MGRRSFFLAPKKSRLSYSKSSEGSDGNGSGGCSSGKPGGMKHPFPAPRVIPRLVNGSLVGAFLPNTLIPSNHPQHVFIKWAAKLMRES